MPSNIDATKPVDGLPASKADLRANLAAAKAEIEALQTQIGTMSPYALRGNRNRIINPMMRIDARGNAAGVTVATSGGNYYAIDRWYGYGLLASGAAFSVSQIQTGPPGFPFALRATVTTPKGTLAAGDSHGIVQAVEGVNWYDVQWGTVAAVQATLTFWVRSSVAGTYAISVVSNAGAYSFVGTYTINATNTWEFKTVQVPGIQSGTWTPGSTAALALRFDLGSGTNFNATGGLWIAANRTTTAGAVRLVNYGSATWDVTGVQLEPGNSATPFERRMDPLEQILCERYYERGQFNIAGYGVAGNIIKTHAPFRTTKRDIPSTVSTPNPTSNLGSTASSPALGGITAQGTVLATGGYAWETVWTADADIFA